MNPVIQLLIGTWFICSTNFPMWIKGNETKPAFNYSILSGKKQNVLTDKVTYLKQGRQKSIKGYDYQDADNNYAFTWRGKGLLRPLKSHWRIVMYDTTEKWAVIYFTKTAFTPEGVDIISRTPYLSQEKLVEIKSRMLNDSLLKKQLPSLKNLNTEHR